MPERTMPLSEVKQVISLSLLKSSNDRQIQAAATLMKGLEKASPARQDTFTRSSSGKPATYTP